MHNTSFSTVQHSRFFSLDCSGNTSRYKTRHKKLCPRVQHNAAGVKNKRNETARAVAATTTGEATDTNTTTTTAQLALYM